MTGTISGRLIRGEQRSWNEIANAGKKASIRTPSRFTENSMIVAALTSSLPLPLIEAIDVLAEIGFEVIDVPPAAARTETRRKLADCGLSIGCVALERDMPQTFDLANECDAGRAAAIDFFARGLEATAELAAPAAYVTPPTASDAATRRRWLESLSRLSETAGSLGVDLCIEHFPGRLVPTVAATLELLGELGHPNAKLLMDVGHCLISGEEPDDAIRLAGDRLGYVHFDDNDGQRDIHWPLFAGRLTLDQAERTIDALRAAGYERSVSLELNPQCPELQPPLDNPEDNLRRGRAQLDAIRARLAD